MGLFSRKKNKAPANTSMAARGGFVEPPPSSDPSLPGLAGWCGSRKDRPLPRRFNYKRPDGKPDRERGFWADPDDPQWS